MVELVVTVIISIGSILLCCHWFGYTCQLAIGMDWQPSRKLSFF